MINLPPSRPSGHQREQGATLIVTVLFVTVLMAVLLASATQLSLSSRAGSGERRDTLKAQYAAESGLAVAVSQLQDVERIFNGDVTATGKVNYLTIPTSTRASDVLALAEQYCGNSAWVQTTAVGVYPVQYRCTATDSAAANRYDVLSQYVNAGALPATFALQLGKSSLTTADLKGYWNQAFGAGVTVDGTRASDRYTATYRLKPTRVERSGITRFRLYMQVVEVTAQGTSAAGVRVVKGTSTNNSEFWFELVLPTFVDRVLFTNYHRTVSGSRPNFTTQTFDGPVHTNDYFTFAAGGSAEFKSRVTSAGCYSFTSSGTCATSGGASRQQAGLIVGSTRYTLGTPQGSVSGTSGSAVSTMAELTGKAPSDTRFAKPPQWGAEFQPMPQNAEDQKAAAEAAGLVIPSGATVTLTASTSATAATPPTVYDATNRSWSPATTHQFITVLSGSVTTVYRVGPGGALEVRSALGAWSVARPAFNGVLYSSGTLNLSGPGRNTAGQAWPALSSASQMTVAANQDISIRNDLTYSDVPCKAPASCAGKPTPTNLLGIYTQAGDISVGTSAPNDLNIHGVTMSSQGEVTVENYNSGSPRGTINLIGGLIENYYGAFGTFDPANPTVLKTGYGRNFSFDERMGEGYGMTPPYFPVSPKWQVQSAAGEGRSLTNLTWQQGAQ